MSASNVTTEERSYQPFQCHVCKSRFTRHENLKRHAALHSRPQGGASLSCEFCSATFSRRDLRQRHMKRKHPEHEDKRVTSRSQLNPTLLTRNIDEGTSLGDKALSNSTSPTETQYGLSSQHSREQGETAMNGGIWHAALQYDQRQLQHGHREFHGELTSPTSSLPTSTGTDGAQFVSDLLTQHPTMDESSYIGHTAHNSTDIDRDALLGASFPKPDRFTTQMQPVMNSQSASLGTTLTTFNFNQGSPDSLLSSSSPHFLEDWSPSVLQTRRGFDIFFTHVSHFVPFLHRPTMDTSQVPRHLLLSILCLAYQYGDDPDCGYQAGTGISLSARCFHRARVLIATDEEGADDWIQNISMVQAYLLLQIGAMMYLCGKDSKYGLKMHSRMISLARAGRLMQPVPIESAATGDLVSLWREFVKAESHKRTLFAVHQVDALWYQFLSVPRSLSHLEIKHDLPCPEDCWTASSSAEWAHRQLLARNSNSSMQYADAVRYFLSRDADLSSVPSFDPYGAINIAQFLISSAREVTGWSTMTGMLSLERLEPLKSSLSTLRPFIRPQNETTEATHTSLLCEATWETAMIELQMWSPSHTGGIVEGSIDAVLNQSTYLASSCEFLCDSDTAKAIQPHINWFLHYLDARTTPEFEAPWVALYAYKAFLIAWDLVRGRISGAMQVVGVDDGDVEGALRWARKVFHRRIRWQLGKLIMACLDMLDK